MEKLYKTDLTPVSAKALSEVLQKYAAREIDELHFSFHSCIDIIKLAALLFRLYRERGNFVWLSPWQLKICWLACYKLGKCPWFVKEHKDRVYSFYPHLIYRYPYENFKVKLD